MEDRVVSQDLGERVKTPNDALVKLAWFFSFLSYEKDLKTAFSQNSESFLLSDLNPTLPIYYRFSEGPEERSGSENANKYLLVETEECFVLAFRGTRSVTDWIHTNAIVIPWPCCSGIGGSFHSGFYSRAKSLDLPALVEFFNEKSDKTILLTGHSLGGAVAAISTLLLLTYSNPDIKNKNRIICITFGQPMVGTRGVADYVRNFKLEHHFVAFIAPNDIVPKALRLIETHIISKSIQSISGFFTKFPDYDFFGTLYSPEPTHHILQECPEAVKISLKSQDITVDGIANSVINHALTRYKEVLSRVLMWKETTRPSEPFKFFENLEWFQPKITSKEIVVEGNVKKLLLKGSRLFTTHQIEIRDLNGKNHSVTFVPFSDKVAINIPSSITQGKVKLYTHFGTCEDINFHIKADVYPAAIADGYRNRSKFGEMLVEELLLVAWIKAQNPENSALEEYLVMIESVLKSDGKSGFKQFLEEEKKLTQTCQGQDRKMSEKDVVNRCKEHCNKIAKELVTIFSVADYRCCLLRIGQQLGVDMSHSYTLDKLESIILGSLQVRLSPSNSTGSSIDYNKDALKFQQGKIIGGFAASGFFGAGTVGAGALIGLAGITFPLVPVVLGGLALATLGVGIGGLGLFGEHVYSSAVHAVCVIAVLRQALLRNFSIAVIGTKNAGKTTLIYEALQLGKQGSVNDPTKTWLSHSFSDPLLSHLCVLDLPGFDEAIEVYRQKSDMGVKLANAFIFVFGVKNVDSSQANLVKELLRSNSGNEEEKEDIPYLIVLTNVDILDEDDDKQALKNHAAATLGVDSNKIILSALHVNGQLATIGVKPFGKSEIRNWVYQTLSNEGLNNINLFISPRSIIVCDPTGEFWFPQNKDKPSILQKLLHQYNDEIIIPQIYTTTAFDQNIFPPGLTVNYLSEKDFKEKVAENKLVLVRDKGIQIALSSIDIENKEKVKILPFVELEIALKGNSDNRPRILFVVPTSLQQMHVEYKKEGVKPDVMNSLIVLDRSLQSYVGSEKVRQMFLDDCACFFRNFNLCANDNVNVHVCESTVQGHDLLLLRQIIGVSGWSEKKKKKG